MNTNSSREIDVWSLLKRVFAEKLLMVKFIVVFAIIGIVYAINQPKRYTANVILAPEATSMGMSQNLGDIANMIGLGSGGSNSVDAIYPDIYPDIFASSDFIIGLFDIPVKQKEDTKSKTYYDHLVLDNPVPFWSYPGIWFSSLFAAKDTTSASHKLNPACLTNKEDGVCNLIRGNISCQLDKGTNLISITATDIDPFVATQIVDTLQCRLQKYITNYRTKKARLDLAYARKANAEAKQQYEKARQIYSSMSDANTDAFLKSVTSKVEDLENEMQLKYNYYSQTSSQVQSAIAKVQEKTPAFTIIQRPTVPLRASSTPRSVMVLVFIILGFVACCSWILFVRDYAMSFLKKRKK